MASIAETSEVSVLRSPDRVNRFAVCSDDTVLLMATGMLGSENVFLDELRRLDLQPSKMGPA